MAVSSTLKRKLERNRSKASNTTSERRHKARGKKANKIVKKQSPSRGQYAVPCHGYLVLRVASNRPI